MKIKIKPFTKKATKRFVLDCVANYVFFAPLVIALTPPLHSVSGASAYLLAAIPITIVGARPYSFFLKRWYKFWNIEF